MPSLTRRECFRLAAGGGLLAVPAFAQAVRQVGGPLKITKVEPFILRAGPEPHHPEPYYIEVPPLGATSGGPGLWNRLEFSETSRMKGYEQTMVVKITTDAGIVGWGEGHAVSAPRATKTVVEDLFTPILLGQDARQIEPLWEKMNSTERLRGFQSGYWKRAMSAIDIALWDILGKASGMPVYQLLGGAFRTRIPTYQGVGGGTVEAVKENVRKLMEEGFTVMKMSLAKGGGDPSDLSRVIAASETIGSKGQLLLDSLGAYKLYEATTLGRRLDQLGNIGWWEDVLLPEDIDGYARLAGSLDAAVCAGEQYTNRFQFRDLFQARAVDIVNPDLARVGITETKRIAIMADAANVLWSPHASMGTAPYRAASFHLCAATPNALIMEGGNAYKGAFGDRLLKEPLGFHGGYVDVPDKPGLGFEFDEQALSKLIVNV